MEQYLWIIWLAIFALAVIIEASGPNLVSIWFAIGSLVSLIISFIPGVAWWIQVIVFVVLSVVSFIALRPIFKRFMKHNLFNTNIDSYTGKKGIVVEEITLLNPGSVKIGDVKWSAIPLDEKEKFNVNDVVEVVAINGNKLIVKKVEEKK
jgi:membrane protein implicated in regulation of membrane protease activity